MPKGSLLIVGTGISVGQITSEVRSYIASADKVLYCLTDAATERLILKSNSNSESLYRFYGENKRRRETYREMSERTMECVREGQAVCVAYYGHPGVLVRPARDAIKTARAEGYPARMVPAISSIDCLICDLEIDTAFGLQVFEATDLMLRKRCIDTSAHVIIMMVSALGDLGYSFEGYDQRNVPSLGRYLSQSYPTDFVIKSYHAAQYSICEPKIYEMKISDLLTEKLSGVSTLYIPPFTRLPIHLSMLNEYKLNYVLDDIRLIPLNYRPGDA